MANRLTGQVWEIDSSGKLVVAGQEFKIKGIAWVGAAVNAVMQVCDASCNVVWRSEASIAKWVDRDYFQDGGLLMRGLTIPSVPSGKLYIQVAT